MKRIKMLMCCVMVVVSLAACGGGGGSTTASANPPSNNTGGNNTGGNNTGTTDTVAPTMGTPSAADTSNVAINKTVTLPFSENLAPLEAGAITAKSGTTPVEIIAATSGQNLSIGPKTAWPYGKIDFTGAVKDVAGNPVNVSFSLTTVSDPSLPAVMYVTDSNLPDYATEVPLHINLVTVYSKPPTLESALQPGNVTVKTPYGDAALTIEVRGNSLVIDPATINIAGQLEDCVFRAKGIKDSDGNIAPEQVIHFKTGIDPDIYLVEGAMTVYKVILNGFNGSWHAGYGQFGTGEITYPGLITDYGIYLYRMGLQKGEVKKGMFTCNSEPANLPLRIAYLNEAGTTTYNSVDTTCNGGLVHYELPPSPVTDNYSRLMIYFGEKVGKYYIGNILPVK